MKKATLTYIPADDRIAQRMEPDDYVVFTHIPKAAGTTLDRLLKGVGIVKELSWQRAFGTVYYQFLGKGKRESIDNFLELPLAAQAESRLITGHVPYGIHEHRGGTPRYVTLLRDPISRTVSHYKMGISRSGWSTSEPLSEVFRKGGLASDVQTRMLAGVQSPFEEITEKTLEKALENLEERYFLVGFSDTFNEFTSLLLGYLDAPNALLGEEQSTRVQLSAQQEEALKEEALAFNRFDVELYEKARAIAEAKIQRLRAGSEDLPPPPNGRPTLLASSQIQFNKSEYSIIPADQFNAVITKLGGKGVQVTGLRA